MMKWRCHNPFSGQEKRQKIKRIEQLRLSDKRQEKGYSKFASYQEIDVP